MKGAGYFLCVKSNHLLQSQSQAVAPAWHHQSVTQFSRLGLKKASPFLLGKERSFKLQIFLCFLSMLVTWFRPRQVLVSGAQIIRGRWSAGSREPQAFVHTWQLQKPRPAIDPGSSFSYRCGNCSPERSHHMVLVLFLLQPKESLTRNKFRLVPPKLA